MAQAEHRLEKRSQLLAARIKERGQAIRDAVAAPGQRPPFHVALSKPDALAWWREHFDDDLGQSVLTSWTPDQVAELQVEMSRAARTDTLGDGSPPTAA